MSKLLTIIKREYWTRVRKRSFIVMTIVGPLLLSGIIILSAYLSMKETERHYILVVDKKAPFFRGIVEYSNCEGGMGGLFPATKLSLINVEVPIICYQYGGDMDVDSARARLTHGTFTSVLYIPENVEVSNTALLFYNKLPSLPLLRTIEKHIGKVLEEQKLRAMNIPMKEFYNIRTDIKVKTIKNKGEKEKTIFTENAVVGLVLSILIYMFIFMYSAQVMRGVLEDKTGRMVEILITSVKPFTLMMGKIIGIAMVGFTQFVIWLILVFVIVGIAWAFFISLKFDPGYILQVQQMTPDLANQLLKKNQFNMVRLYENWVLFKINIPLLVAFFIFYFLFGYLMYSSLFAAVGAIVDSDTDVNQFLLPVTVPLIFAYLMMPAVLANPDGDIAKYLTLIPLTSPIIVMVRIPMYMGEAGQWMGTPDFYISMLLLVLGFIIAVFISARLYRVGILKYGKKPTYMEVIKWLFARG